MYAREDIEHWIKDNLGAEHVSGNEIKTSCPRCSHPNFYFNTKKKVGWCHKDSCHWNPSLKDLITLIGFPPSTQGIYFSKGVEEEKINEIIMIDGASPVLTNINGITKIAHYEAYVYLLNRNIHPKDIIKFNVLGTKNRVIVPVYDKDNKLISYVSRSIDPTEKRYLYPKGGQHKKYLLGWEECKLWNELMLVENTFVSMWLRNSLGCTTNFGSSLSHAQVTMIKKSKIKEVFILWDEGAETAAEKATLALRSSGVKAIYGMIKGQPDDYSISKLISIKQIMKQHINNIPPGINLKDNSLW